MTSVTLTLEEITKRRRRAIQKGKHDAVRVWEELERRAKRNRRKTEMIERELERMGGRE